MSEPEKIRETPKLPPEQAKEPSVSKTGQSAFDKILEQQKIAQQSPLLQGKIADQGAGEQKVKEVVQKHEQEERRQKGDDKEESGSRDKTRQKEKSSLTVTKEAVGKAGEKKGFGSGAGSGGGRSGFGGEGGKRHASSIAKRLSDAKGQLTNISQSTFASKLSQAIQSAKLSPQQLQALVNQIVQSVQLGKNELGEGEILLILKDHIFKGMRLRFTSIRGKVSIQFEAKTPEAKKLFASESGKIRAELEKKGVKVLDIKIT